LREEAPLTGFFRRNKRCYTLEEASVILAAGGFDGRFPADSQLWTQNDAKHAISALINLERLKRLKSFPWKNKIG
jgi:hypothetical protein